jgi:hypothetical protein
MIHPVLRRIVNKRFCELFVRAEALPNAFFHAGFRRGRNHDQG